MAKSEFQDSWVENYIYHVFSASYKFTQTKFVPHVVIGSEYFLSKHLSLGVNLKYLINGKMDDLRGTGGNRLIMETGPYGQYITTKITEDGLQARERLFTYDYSGLRPSLAIRYYFGSGARDDVKTNMAVADFVAKNVSQADASIVADFMRTELVELGGFNVMNRNNMDTVLAEQKFQSSGCTEQECAVQMGKLLNVRQMAVGSLSKLQDTYYVTVNMVDVESGKILASYGQEASSASGLRNSCRAIAWELTPGHRGSVLTQKNTRPQGRINMAVVDFVAKNAPQAEAAIVTDFLRDALVRQNVFNMMARNNIDAILAEQKFQSSGCTEQECAVQVGKLLSVKWVAVGQLSKLLDKYYLAVDLVDVETGKIIASYNREAQSSAELKDTCRTLAKDISSK